MDIITVDSREVIKYVQCNGSGICSHGDHFAAFIRTEKDRWAKVVQDADVKVE